MSEKPEKNENEPHRLESFLDDILEPKILDNHESIFSSEENFLEDLSFEEYKNLSLSDKKQLAEQIYGCEDVLERLDELSGQPLSGDEPHQEKYDWNSEEGKWKEYEIGDDYVLSAKLTNRGIRRSSEEVDFAEAIGYIRVKVNGEQVVYHDPYGKDTFHLPRTQILVDPDGNTHDIKEISEW